MILILILAAWVALSIAFGFVVGPMCSLNDRPR